MACPLYLLFEHDLFGKPPPSFPDHALFHAFDQFHRAGRRADLALVNHIGKDIARRLLWLRRIDPRQVIRLTAAGP
jgi:hypothetical protein